MQRASIVSGTKYRVRSEHNKRREEVFVVVDPKKGGSYDSDEEAMLISSDTPFAHFLSDVSEGEGCVFQERDGSEVEYEIVSIEVPPVDHSQRVSPLSDWLQSRRAVGRFSDQRSSSIPSDVWACEEAWRGLRREDWATALSCAAMTEFVGPFPELHPQGDLLRFVVKKGDLPRTIVDCWSQLPARVRFLVIALIVKNELRWSQAAAIKEKERSPDFRLLIDLIVNSRGRIASARERAFSEFNTALQELIVMRAWKSDQSIDLAPLLPECALGIYAHCEAQDWKKGSEWGLVWCRRGPCSEAHLTPDRTLPLDRWSLPEFLDVLEIEPLSSVVVNRREYVTKLGGWVNRLNDIRERLRCSHCSEFMQPHGSYPKNLARYHVTVVQCENSECAACGKGVYLSHCWACQHPIDSSRETPIRVEERYVCAHCGSGPQKSDTYSQGDVCPACGSRDMRQLGKARQFRCQNCMHTTRLPPQWAMTGPRRAEV